LTLLRSTWVQSQPYTFLDLQSLREHKNIQLLQRYEDYKLAMPSGVVNGNEQLYFHGCAEADISSILTQGFLTSFQRSSTGNFQRFGPGFYCSPHAAKAHRYPLQLMKSLPTGEHVRSMIMCKVAKGLVLSLTQNMPTLDRAKLAAMGYHSVHAVARAQPGHGALGADELVVYDEAAVLPFAVVTYRFKKAA
jgi:hypothetical protein